MDLSVERRNGDFVRAQILSGPVRACHDCSDGGLLVAVAEMAMPFRTGVSLLPAPTDLSEHAFWFGEDQARYVLAVLDAGPLLEAARAAGIPARRLGRSDDRGALVLAGDRSISVRSLRDAHEATLPALMAEA